LCDYVKNPDDADVQYQLGRALHARGENQAASIAFGKARTLKADTLNQATIPGIR
jgi:Flp pilus assembly protein TadD